MQINSQTIQNISNLSYDEKVELLKQLEELLKSKKEKLKACESEIDKAMKDIEKQKADILSKGKKANSKMNSEAKAKIGKAAEKFVDKFLESLS